MRRGYGKVASDPAADDAELDSIQEWHDATNGLRRRAPKKHTGPSTRAITKELVRSIAGTRKTPNQPDPTVVAELVTAASVERSGSHASREADGATTVTARRRVWADPDAGAGVYRWLRKEGEQLEEPQPALAAKLDATASSAAPNCTAKSSGTETRKVTGNCRPVRSTGTYTKKSTASAVASLLGSTYKPRVGAQLRWLS